MGYIGNSNPSVTSLGGDIDVNGHQIKSSSNGNIQILPDGSGTVTIDVLTFPVADGTNGQALVTDGSGTLSFSTIAPDTGNMSFSGNVMSSTGDIELTPANGSYVKINERVYIRDGGDVNPSYEQDDFNFYGGGSGGYPSVSTSFLGTNGAFKFSDNTQVFWGSSADFQIEHEDGNNRTIARIGNHPFRFASKTDDNTLLEMNDQAGVKLYWSGSANPALETITGNAVKFNNAFTFPTADGTSGQQLQTNGSGTVTWETPSGGGRGGSSYTTIVIDTNNANTAPETKHASYSGDGTIMIGSGGHSYGDYNVGIGFEAECQPYYGLPSMAKCVAIGYYAHADAYQSTAIGRQVTTAYGSNTATGIGASVDTSVAGGYGCAIATPMGASNGQNDNISIGRGAGGSGNYSIVICSSDTVTVSHDFSIFLTTRKDGVYNAQASTATSQISIGGSTHAVRFCESYTFPSADGSSGQQLQTDGSGTLSWASASSDIRLKKNLSDNDMGLDFINELDTKVYNFKSYKEIDKSDSQLSHYKPLEYGEDGHDGATQTEDDIPKNLANKKGWQRGLIAQDVKAVLDKYGHENFKGWGEDKHGVQEIYLDQFIVPLIKAVQELSEEVKTLKNNCKC